MHFPPSTLSRKGGTKDGVVRRSNGQFRAYSIKMRLVLAAGGSEQSHHFCGNESPLGTDL